MLKGHHCNAASRIIGASALLLLTAFSQPRPAQANGALNVPILSATGTSLPVAIAPYDANIKYGGRFDTRDTAGPKCSWSGTSVMIKFTATSVNVKLNEGSANDQYEIVVDGQLTGVLATSAGVQLYNVWSGANGTHTLLLVRRTEAFYGISQFEGFQLASGGVLSTPPASNGRGIEIVGDSISCGYANEAANQNQTLTNTNEDAYLAYGNVAATALGADFADIAWSGRKMWPDNTMPSIYDYTNPTDTSLTWGFSWVPGAVIINLSTNDFGAGAPDETSWTTAYEQFISHLRTHYPNAMVYCATSPMIADPTWTTVQTYLQKIVSDKAAAGDNKVKILNIPTQNGSLYGYGGDWHPSLQEDMVMAGIILSQVQTDLGWTVSVAPGAPVTVAATIPGNGVSLTWSATGYSTSFSVKRSTTNGGPYTTVGTVTSQVATYNDTSTTNGVTYYYVVSATNSAGTSPNSAQVSAVPEPAPTFTSSAIASPSTVAAGSVTAVTLTIKDTAAVGLTNGNVLLQIDDSSNNVAASNTWSGVNFSAGQTLQFTYNWTPTVTGTYTVNLGVFDAGWTTGYTWNGPAATITVTAGSAPPPAPTGLTAAAGNAQVSLSWASSTGGTAYDVKRSTVNGSGYATVSSPTTTSYTNTGLTNGTTYYFVVDAKNANGTSGNSSQASATPTNVSTPYGGAAWAIPGTVQSENYDVGGESIAYHDTDSTNNGGQYRTAEGVDVETCADTGTGFDVAYTAAGEWMKYTCNVGTAGTYNISFRLASPTAGNTCHLEDTNGTNLTGVVSVPNTAGWQTWQTVTVNNVSLTAGSHVLKFVEDTGGYNINYIGFASSATAPPAPTGLAGTPTDTQIALTWNASSGATSYNVYRRTSAGGESGTAIATGLTGTTYTNTGLTDGTNYFYTVKAVNASGTSGASNETSGLPAQYNFESGAQGWTFNAAPITGVAQSTTQAFGRTHSLAVTINGAAANATARISNPATAAGKVVTYRVWIPAGSQLSAVQPYVMDHNWLWTGNIVPLASLTQGAWNTITVTVPANAVMPLNELGVEFRVSATWSSTCYIDSISW